MHNAFGDVTARALQLITLDASILVSATRDVEKDEELGGLLI